MKIAKIYCTSRRDRRQKATALIDRLETSGIEAEVHYSEAKTVELTGVYWDEGNQTLVHFFINDK